VNDIDSKKSSYIMLIEHSIFIFKPIGSMVERPPPILSVGIAEGCGFESHVGCKIHANATNSIKARG
jgi:hypothetical protein